MTPQRWAQVADVYERALATPADQRQSFLKTCCRDDVDLRQQVDSLLQQSTEGFLDQPIGMAAVTLLSADGPRLSIGQQVGPCIVESLVGVGGMGEVYRARDTQLERTVALKVLTGVHAKDSERAVHVRREAQVLASLNHPNIAAIYGIEAGAGVLALVLEFVDGSTLADLIGRKSLSVEDSLKIARQVAEALEVAHDKGITHRDLKPANIKVTPDGVVKVLDFGLARFAAPDHDAVFSNATATPTGPTTALTTDALAIGTPAYMAPEQLRGRPADKRTDVWAFG
jgi:serine/threonine-protein kinase